MLRKKFSKDELFDHAGETGTQSQPSTAYVSPGVKAPLRPQMMKPPICYQLHIRLTRPKTITIGRLGRFDFPAGRYVYTGSARHNLESRIRRHMSRKKRLRWHVDCRCR